MQSMSLLGVWGHAPQEKNLKNACNLVLSEAQNCYAKDRLWKSAMRKIITIHPWF